MTAPISSESSRQLARVARGGALNLVGAVVAAVGGFLLIIVVANQVDDATAGSVFAATSLTLILYTVATLGTDTGLARFVLPLEAKHRYADLLGVIRTSATTVTVVAVAISVVLLVGAPAFAPLVGLEGSEGASIIRIVAIAVPFATLSDQALALTRAFSKMRPTVALDDMLRPLLQLGLVSTGALLGWGAVGLAGAYSLPFVSGAILAGVVATRIVGERRGRWGEHPHPSTEIRREFWLYTWPRAVARVTQIAVQRLDIVLIAVLLDAADAAVYTAATRFVVFGQLAGQAIYRVLQPRFSALLGRGEHETVRDVFRISTAWTMASSWPIYLGVAVGAPLYMRLFGSGYAGDGIPVVVIMAVAMMAAMAAGPLDTLLLMAGKSLASLLIALTTMTVDVILCFALIPHLGIAGAAVAWGIAVLTKNVLSFWQVKRTTGMVPLSSAGAIVGGACVVAIGLPLLGVGYLTDWAILPYAVTGVLGVAAYGAVLWAARAPLALDSVLDAFRRRGAG
jgi:O-antigen/teichoic acid export membrane protein